MLGRLVTVGLFCWLITAPPAAADQGAGSPVGRWITAQHNAVIQIAPCGADMCGQIVGLLPVPPGGAMPTDWQGRPQCGMRIIETAPATDANGQRVWKGQVLDPRNGNVYQAQIRLDQDRHLQLHGYVGLPIFGQTQTWTPFSGRTLADCRLAAVAGPQGA